MLESIRETIADVLKGKPRARRSGKWPALRRAHLKAHPKCEVCGTTKRVSVHHILPVNVSPAMELEVTNLISLCEHNEHHLTFGHLGNWKSRNPDVEIDVAEWSKKYRGRP